LGGRKGIRPVKTMSGGVLAWLSGTRCRLAYGPADATAHTVSCFSKIQIGFTFLVPAHPGSPGKRAVKRVYVCVYALQVASYQLLLANQPSTAVEKPVKKMPIWDRMPNHINHMVWLTMIFALS